jgi:xeroderma pigmentosum group C-complementing protein
LEHDPSNPTLIYNIMSFHWSLSDSEEEQVERNEWIHHQHQHHHHHHHQQERRGDDDANHTNITSPFIDDESVEKLSFASKNAPENDKWESSDEEEEEEEIDWEDAHHHHDDVVDDDKNEGDTAQQQDDDRKMPATSIDTAATASLRPLTINLNENYGDDPSSSGNKNKKRKRPIQRRRFRLESLPPNLQSLLEDLHRSSLLVLTSRAMYLSNLCTQSEVLAIAQSLIPLHWVAEKSAISTIPRLQELDKFMRWFGNRVHGVEERRRQQARRNIALGAPVYRQRRSRTQPQPRKRQKTASIHFDSPRLLQSLVSAVIAPSSSRLAAYCSYLSASRDHDVQIMMDDEQASFTPFLWTETDQTLLFLAMIRSLGWRARLVMNMDPIKHDLDVDHPLLADGPDDILFGSRRSNPQSAGTSPVKPATSRNSCQCASTPSLIWVEVLCQDGSTRNQSKHRWVHVDPARTLFDCPDQVEKIIHTSMMTDSASSSSGSRKGKPLAYVLAVEHKYVHSETSSGMLSQPFRMTDVTPRYAMSWVASLRERGLVRNKNAFDESLWKESWWSQTIHMLNHVSNAASPASHAAAGKCSQDPIVIDDIPDSDKKMPALAFPNHNKEEDNEADELKGLSCDEAIPTSKAAFQTHPVYVLPSLLGSVEVLVPEAKNRVKGVFKGELIYLRSDVSKALTEKKWLYEGRKVLPSELPTPIKRVKARKKPVSKSFKPLKSYGVGTGNDGSDEQRAADIAQAEKPLDDDELQNLYAVWQTEPWSPPYVGPNDPLPVNEFRNIELALLNPGLVHIADKGEPVAAAKQLHIPYAPCLLGFEGHGGNRTPNIRGIVVHAHNEQLIREACAEMKQHAMVEEEDARRRLIHSRWKKLMNALLIKDRIDREYADK